MKNDKIANLIKYYNQRREQLGMSQTRLAELSGVSLPTLQRFFSEHSANVTLDTISKIAQVLGLSLTTEEVVSTQTMLENQAHQKAEKLAGMVQATSALEAQGVSADSYKAIKNQLFYGLISGSKRRLWSA